MFLVFPTKSQEEFLSGRFVSNRIFVSFFIHDTTLNLVPIVKQMMKLY